LTPSLRRLTCSSCDRRSPLTLASVQIPTATATARPTVHTFPFEENAGVAFRSRTQTISRESNVFVVLLFSISAPSFPNADLFFSLLGARSDQTGSDGPKREGKFLRCHFDDVTVRYCKHQIA